MFYELDRCSYLGNSTGWYSNIRWFSWSSSAELFSFFVLLGFSKKFLPYVAISDKIKLINYRILNEYMEMKFIHCNTILSWLMGATYHRFWFFSMHCRSCIVMLQTMLEATPAQLSIRHGINCGTVCNYRSPDDLAIDQTPPHLMFSIISRYCRVPFVCAQLWYYGVLFSSISPILERKQWFWQRSKFPTWIRGESFPWF